MRGIKNFFKRYFDRGIIFRFQKKVPIFFHINTIVFIIIIIIIFIVVMIFIAIIIISTIITISMIIKVFLICLNS